MSRFLRSDQIRRVPDQLDHEIPHRRFDTQLTGDAVSGEYYDPANTTLSAKWIDEAEFLKQFLGTSFEYAIELEAGVSQENKFDSSSQVIYFKFTATESGSYTIQSYSLDDSGHYKPDTNCTMYDSDKDSITSNDDGGEGYQFLITRTLEAGETYYFVVECWTSGGGNFSIIIE